MKTGFRDRPISANFRFLAENARYMRQHPTEAELLMWTLLRGNRFGVNFRRQHIIGDYIVDFACLLRSLVIEIDGEYHQTNEQIKEDAIRTEWLKQRGFTVIRFKNDEIFNNLDYVNKTIERYTKFPL